jgi:hypothetical protein
MCTHKHTHKWTEVHLCTLSTAPPSLSWIAQNSKTVSSTKCRPNTKFYPNWAITVKSTDKNSFIPFSEAQLSLSWISVNPQSLSKFLWTCHVLDCIQIRRKMYKWGKNFIYGTMYIFHRADFHETLTCSVVLSRYVPYHISPKSVKKYGQCGYKLIYALKLSMNVTEWVFKKMCLLNNFLKKPPIMNFNAIQNPVTCWYQITDVRQTWPLHNAFFSLHTECLKM